MKVCQSNGVFKIVTKSRPFTQRSIVVIRASHFQSLTFEYEFVIFRIILTAQRYASAVFGIVVCLSVRPSVCPSHASIILK